MEVLGNYLLMSAEDQRQVFNTKSTQYVESYDETYNSHVWSPCNPKHLLLAIALIVFHFIFFIKEETNSKTCDGFKQ